MKVYPTSQIRNIAFISHGGAGKTSLAEAMLYNTGVTSRLGRVDDGNTVSDYLPEEIKRKISVSTSLIPCEYRDHKINILDTPGFADFLGEVRGAVKVAENALVVISAVAGVEVQTEIFWEEAQDLPKIAFINRMDRENANFEKALADMRSKLHGTIVPLQIPIGAETDFKGVVDLLKMKALFFGADGKYREEDIPAELMGDIETYKEQLVEAAAEGNDDLLNKYLEGEELTNEEIKSGIAEAASKGAVVFVFCGSATSNIGVLPVMDFIVDCMASPSQAEGKDNEPLAALIFKTNADPYIGRLNFLKVVQGKLKADSVAYNFVKEKDEKINQILVMRGKDQQAVPEAHTGDIVAVAKLTETTTGDTLTVKSNPQEIEPIEFPVPNLGTAIEPKAKGDEDKLGSALQKLMEEDPTIKLEKNAETKQTILTTMGESHSDIIIERLNRKFGVEVRTVEMKIPYRETIRGQVQVEGKHKKQSGGHGQYGHVWLRLEPSEEEFVFGEELFGGSVPKQYVPAVEKGLREALPEGVLAGYPVTNMKAILYDGSYHSVDSSEMAFKLAAILAFRKGVEQANPAILEPICNIEVEIPEQFMGDIIGDLNSKRGRVLGMEPSGRNQVIKAQVPYKEVLRYSIDLKAITQGRGKYKLEFDHYEEAPPKVAEEVIAKAKKDKE
ncbi:MAG: elongation factor G [Syntrophomonadaceae bacterium]|nr:elongation factor G [Syntrophomonadaceae bacterium]